MRVITINQNSDTIELRYDERNIDADLEFDIPAKHMASIGKMLNALLDFCTDHLDGKLIMVRLEEVNEDNRKTIEEY